MGEISRQSIAENRRMISAGGLFFGKNVKKPPIFPACFADNHRERTGQNETQERIANEKDVDDGGEQCCRWFVI